MCNKYPFTLKNKICKPRWPLGGAGLADEAHGSGELCEEVGGHGHLLWTHCPAAAAHRLVGSRRLRGEGRGLGSPLWGGGGGRCPFFRRGKPVTNFLSKKNPGGGLGNFHSFFPRETVTLEIQWVIASHTTGESLAISERLFKRSHLLRSSSLWLGRYIIFI